MQKEVKHKIMKWTVTRKNDVLQKISSAPQIECEAEMWCCFKNKILVKDAEEGCEIWEVIIMVYVLLVEYFIQIWAPCFKKDWVWRESRMEWQELLEV